MKHFKINREFIYLENWKMNKSLKEAKELIQATTWFGYWMDFLRKEFFLLFPHLIFLRC